MVEQAQKNVNRALFSGGVPGVKLLGCGVESEGQNQGRRPGFVVAICAHLLLMAGIGLCLFQITELMAVATGIEARLSDESAEVRELIVWPWLLVGAIVVMTLDILVLKRLFADERPGQAGAWGWFVTLVFILCLATLSRRLTDLTLFIEELRATLGVGV